MCEQAMPAHTPVLAKNLHPFENRSLKMDGAFELLGLTNRLLCGRQLLAKTRRQFRALSLRCHS